MKVEGNTLENFKVTTPVFGTDYELTTVIVFDDQEFNPSYIPVEYPWIPYLKITPHSFDIIIEFGLDKAKIPPKRTSIYRIYDGLNPIIERYNSNSSNFFGASGKVSMFLFSSVKYPYDCSIVYQGTTDFVIDSEHIGDILSSIYKNLFNIDLDLLYKYDFNNIKYDMFKSIVHCSFFNHKNVSAHWVFEGLDSNLYFIEHSIDIKEHIKSIYENSPEEPIMQDNFPVIIFLGFLCDIFEVANSLINKAIEKPYPDEYKDYDFTNLPGDTLVYVSYLTNESLLKLVPSTHNLVKMYRNYERFYHDWISAANIIKEKYESN